MGEDRLRQFGPAIACMNVRDDASVICWTVDRETIRCGKRRGWCLVDWNSARHPGNVTEYGVATLDDLIHYRGKTSQVCDCSISDVVLPSDDEYLTLTLSGL